MSPFRFLHLLLILLFSYASANTYHSLLRMVPDDRVFSGSAGFRGAADGIFCDSWRLSVETNNAGHWRIIPENCLGMVEEYMNGDRYSSDSDVVGADSLSFAMTVQIEGDGKDIWIFDIDETLLSNLPYYVVHGYGDVVTNLAEEKATGEKRRRLSKAGNEGTRSKEISLNALHSEVPHLLVKHEDLLQACDFDSLLLLISSPDVATSIIIKIMSFCTGGFQVCQIGYGSSNYIIQFLIPRSTFKVIPLDLITDGCMLSFIGCFSGLLGKPDTCEHIKFYVEILGVKSMDLFWQVDAPIVDAKVCGDKFLDFQSERSEVFNETSFDEWVDLAKAPALPTSLWLYEELLGLGFQIVLLTGRSTYTSYDIVEWQTADIGKSAVVYKSERRAELEAQGFRIHGNSGDQWSDLLGSPMTKRSFKLPNPMYCVE
ncbi:hypothetical protein ZIOFF_018155 [Zingiber officinale]|uniref:Acid phosphatase n=1 Tax=Zingiber officinale TaxID=94328 RepID=A0A8J5H7U8_ZINOF|nr:hypothetical protein ZIOFF_018155 [Zingiber officinale]